MINNDRRMFYSKINLDIKPTYYIRFEFLPTFTIEADSMWVDIEITWLIFTIGFVNVFRNSL
jgi:hypothetical protein